MNAVDGRWPVDVTEEDERFRVDQLGEGVVAREVTRGSGRPFMRYVLELQSVVP